MFRRHSFAAIVAIALFCTPASADPDPAPGFDDFFSLERLGMGFAHQAIISLRTQTELEYQFMSFDLARGAVVISGVTARPPLPYDQAQQCVITADRATVQSDLSQPLLGVANMSVNLIGVQVNAACFPRDAAMGLRAMGMNDVVVDQFKISASYVHASGEIAADVAVRVNDFAALDIAASGMPLPRPNAIGPNNPALRILRAVATLKDQGGWEKAAAFLPESYRDPETIKAIGTETILQVLGQDGLRTVPATERNFVDDLMGHVGDFVSGEGEIAIEADLPATGVIVEPDIYLQSPEQLISLLALQARTAPMSRSRIPDTETLASLRNPEDLSAAERVDLAEALLNGIGVPRAPALVPELLDPVFDNADLAGRAGLLTAQAIAASDPSGAYLFALAAGEQGLTGALPLLDQIEGKIGSVEVLDLQADLMADAPSAMDMVTSDDPRELRALSLRHLTGAGAIRSYAQAYYYALLAEAAGDIGASALRSEIDARFTERGTAVAEAWTTLRQDLQTEALIDWIDGGLSESYKID